MMRSALSLLAVVLSLLVATVTAKSVSGDRVLVLLDDLAQQDTYSRFWQSLKDREYNLDFKSANDGNVALFYFGDLYYNHIIHFAPKTASLGAHKALNNVELVKFVNKGGNILVATGVGADATVRNLAGEFGIEVDQERVFDHNGLNKAHSHVTTSNIIGPQAIVGATKAPIVYSGVSIFTGKLPLLSRVLAAEPESFSADSYDANASPSIGRVELVGVMQARNSARVSVSGSLELFSDAFFDKAVPGYEKSGNEEFVAELSKWTFQEKSVLKVVDHRHHKEGSDTQPDWYRIKDDIVYTLEIAEYDGQGWVPFQANDIQLEVIMVDPYIRTTLNQTDADGNDFGRFEGHIKLPDVYGVFTYKVNYKRPGLSNLVVEDVVAIRPFRHNEYPRFLTAAYPYYASVGSMIVGFLVFSAVWLSTWGSHGGSKQKTQ